MTGVFENLAADDSDRRTAQRVATAVATKRVRDRFGAFLAAAESASERTARLNVARGDIEEVIASACNEYGGDPESIKTSVFKHLAIAPNHLAPGADYTPGEFAPGQDYTANPATPACPNCGTPSDGSGVCAGCGAPEGPQNHWDNNPTPGLVASTQHEARRPKMCPYHREVTDISLAAGEPAAGFNAMAQHAWGAQHCQGGEYEGGCNFKPAMTTQKFWDDKADQAEQRKRERQERADQAQEQQEIIDQEVAPDDATELGAETTEPVIEDSGINAELSEAPSAVGQGAEPAATLEPMAAKAAALPSDTLGEYNPAEQAAPDPLDVQATGETINLEPDWDGVRAWVAQLEQTDPAAAQGIKDAMGNENPDFQFSDTELQNANQPGYEQPAPVADRGVAPDGLPSFSNTKQGEALKTVDVEQGSAKDGSPKIDKSKIPADGLPEIDTEGEGSPNPTVRVDPLEPIIPENNESDFLEGTRSVTETQDVEKTVDTKADTSYSWGGNNGASPVTSSENPIKDLMEKGFVPDNQVDAAIKDFEDA